MAGINIQDEICWVCDKNKGDTVHHGIPQHLTPAKNVTIPVCRKCHDQINSEDITGMYAYLHKVSKQSEQVAAGVGIIRELLNNSQKLNKK